MVRSSADDEDVPAWSDEFDQHVRAVYPDLLAQLYAIHGDPEDAHAAVQHGLTAAWRRWSSVRTLPDPAAWIRRSALHAPLRRRPRPARSPDPASAPGEPAGPAESPTAAEPAVLGALHRLPVVQRRALVLHHMAGLAPEQVAVEESAPPGTVHQRLAHGELALTRLLDEQRRSPLPTELDRLQHALAAESPVPPTADVVGRAPGRRLAPATATPGDRRRAVLGGLVVGLAVLLVGLGFTATRPATYTVTSVLSLAPRDSTAVSAATVEMVARSYQVYLSSPSVLAQAARDAGEPRQVMRDAIDVRVETGTANVQTSATLPSASDAAALANTLSAQGAAKAAGDALVVADLVSPAVPGAAVMHPPRPLLAAGTALAALLVGAVAAWALARRRAHSPELVTADRSTLAADGSIDPVLRDPEDAAATTRP